MSTYRVLVKAIETLYMEKCFTTQANSEEEACANIQQKIDDEEIGVGDLHEAESASATMTPMT